MGSHIVDGKFQSDKYPTCPAGKVPLSVEDVTAQDLLWEYAQRRRKVDADFSSDLELSLLAAGYCPTQARLPSGASSCNGWYRKTPGTLTSCSRFGGCNLRNCPYFTEPCSRADCDGGCPSVGCDAVARPSVIDRVTAERDQAMADRVGATEPVAASFGAMLTMAEVERRYVRQVLDAVHGNKTHAARILGIDRRSLYRRIEEGGGK